MNGSIICIKKKYLRHLDTKLQRELSRGQLFVSHIYKQQACNCIALMTGFYVDECIRRTRDFIKLAKACRVADVMIGDF
jgi:hypothetical protein